LENKSVAAKENIKKRQIEELNNFVNQDMQNSVKPVLGRPSIQKLIIPEKKKLLKKKIKRNITRRVYNNNNNKYSL